MRRACHLSSVHQAEDVRIFHKECKSLAEAGWDVHLVTRGGLNTPSAGITHHRMSEFGTKWRPCRMLLGGWNAFRAALSTQAHVYQFHDPELLPFGLLLKWMGKRVIYDVHEDLPRDILAKPWIPSRLRGLFAKVFGKLEMVVAKRLNAVVAATPAIQERFLRANDLSVDIRNYPRTEELSVHAPWEEKCAEVCYIGGIAADRGIRELVAAVEYLSSSVRINLAGRFAEAEVEAEVKGLPGWRQMHELGFLDRAGVRSVLARSIAGLVNLHRMPGYVDALPVKMFEYMAAGIPVIASDFPLWREIVEGNDCGLCVDPLDPAAIAAAIDFLVTHPERARAMGENGKRAVLEKYNWKVEGEKLVKLYEMLWEGGRHG